MLPNARESECDAMLWLCIDMVNATRTFERGIVQQAPDGEQATCGDPGGELLLGSDFTSTSVSYVSGLD